MNSISTKAELIIGVGEFLKLDVSALVNNIEAEIKDLQPSGESIEQLSTSSVVLQTDQPSTIDILGGTPQTSVRLLVVIADPI